MFEAVVLMGGFGTRLKSVSGDTPKPMVPVAGKPFVYHLLEKLEKAGCSRIVLSLHYQAGAIKTQILKDSPVTCELLFVVEDTPLGTGGGIKLASELIEGDYFIALNGDTYSAIDYSKFHTSFNKKQIVLAGSRVEDSLRYGALNYDDEYNLISMNEKGAGGDAIINCGTYLIKKSAIATFPATEFSFEEEFIPKQVGGVKVYVFEGDFIDIGVPEDYYRACELLT